MSSTYVMGSNPSSMLFDNRIERQPNYLTSFELSKVLNVSVHTVRAWRKLRIITPKKFGRSVRWPLDEVIEELSKKDIS
jgi:hypothetical protein